MASPKDDTHIMVTVATREKIRRLSKVEKHSMKDMVEIAIDKYLEVKKAEKQKAKG